MISEEIRLKAQAYFVQDVANLGSFTEEIFIMPDHIHWLCTLPRTITVADLVKNVKISTSIKFKTIAQLNFEWQKGYGAFSVSESGLATVKNYIKNQQNHHNKTDFQAEFRRILEEHRIGYDEKHVWD